MFMSINKWFSLAIMLVALFFIWGIPQTVSAQTGCEGVRFDDYSSDYNLNQQPLCDAAKQFLNRGYQVYFYLTDFQTDDREIWFQRLDQVQTQFQIWDGITFTTTALAFQASTMDNNQVACTVTMGDVLFYGTPLENDQVRLGLKGRFCSRLNMATETSEGFTQALVETVLDAYQLAYPLAIAQPTLVEPIVPIPQAVQPTPQVVQPPQVAPVIIPTAAPQVEPLREIPVQAPVNVDLSGAVSTFLLVVVVVSMAAGFSVVVVRLVRAQQDRRRKVAQITVVKNILNTVILVLDKLLDYPDIAQSELYQFGLAIYGLGSYPELAKQVLERLTAARDATYKARESFKKLVDGQTRGENLDSLLTDWEQLAILVLSGARRLYGMSQAEAVALLNPRTVLPRDFKSTDPVVVALTRLFDGLSIDHDEARISSFMSVQPDESMPGILLYVECVKLIFTNLEEARVQAPDLISQAEAALVQAHSFKYVTEWYPQDVALKFAIDGIEAAKTAASTETWQVAAEAASQVLAGLNRLPQFLQQVSEMAEQLYGYLQDVATIRAEGFTLVELKTIEDQIAQDRKNLLKAGEVADWNVATQMLTELGRNGLEMQLGAINTQQLKNQNEKRLAKLAQLVAETHALAMGEAATALQALAGYPPADWQDVEQNLTQAQGILEALMDNPERADDAASKIAEQTGFNKQDFKGAEAALDAAYAQRELAEKLLHDLVRKLEQIQAAEKVALVSLNTARGELESAQALVLQHDQQLPEELEQMLQKLRTVLDEADQAIKRREYLKAVSLVATVRQQLVSELAQANEQIRAIDTALNAVDEQRDQAEVALQVVEAQNNALLAAVRDREITVALEQARAGLSSVRSLETGAAGLEDQAWLDRLNAIRAGYADVLRLIGVVKTTIENAQNRYDQLRLGVNRAISSAKSAIDSAKAKVGNSKAHAAGRHTLNRAIELLPTLPAVGATFGELSRASDAAEAALIAAGQAAGEAQREIDETEQQEKIAREEIARQNQIRLDREAEEARERQREVQERIFEAARHQDAPGGSRHQDATGGGRHQD